MRQTDPIASEDLGLPGDIGGMSMLRATSTTKSRRRSAVVTAAAAAFLTALVPLAPSASAASVSLDPTYASGGILTLSQPNGSFDAFQTVVSQGVTYVAGDVYDASTDVIRVYARNAAGGPVAAFSGDGIFVRTSPANEDEIVGGTAAAPGGGIFVLLNRFVREPYGPLDDKVLKLLASGEVDTTYGGGDGIADVPAGSADSVNGFAVDDAGRLYLAGARRNSSDTADIPTITRLTAAGAADTSFSATGVIDSPVSFTDASITELVVGPDNLPYYLQLSYSPSSAELVRLTDAGALDVTFSDDGHLTVTDTRAGGLLVSRVGLNAGSVVVGIRAATTSDPARVLRLTSAGVPDTTFGSSGLVALPLDGTCFGDLVAASVEDALGRLIVLRASCPRSAADPYRLSTTGVRDTGFALVNGLKSTHYVYVDDVDVLPDGGVLLSGNHFAATAWGSHFDIAKVTADKTAPSVSTVALPVFSLAATSGLSFSGADSGTGVANFDVRYRRAPWNAGFGALSYPSAWQRTTARSVSLAAVAGGTTCFSARSRDKAGNTSAWSAERCSAKPLDDRSLTASTGWTRSTGASYYLGTVTTTTRSAAVLTRTGVQARRLSLVASRCPGCGSVGVYWNGTLIRKITLNSTTTAHKQLFFVTDFGAARSGTVTVKALNTGRTLIDGLATSRT